VQALARPLGFMRAALGLRRKRLTFGGSRPTADYRAVPAVDTKLALIKAAGQATVIGAVITDAALSQKQAKRLAVMAQDGLAMSVQPAHTPLDGDTIFTLRSCAVSIKRG